MSKQVSSNYQPLRQSDIFTPEVIEDIQVKAELGRYRIRGFGTLRERRWSTFDDLTFIPCTLTRIPLEGYRERCSPTTILGTRFANTPIQLDIPIMITGMSWGALSYNAKVALAKGANIVGSSNTTGDGRCFESISSPSYVQEESIHRSCSHDRTVVRRHFANPRPLT